MTQVCEAIYDKGVFRPVKPVDSSLSDGQHVRLIVESSTPEEILRLAADVYEGLSEQQVEEIERIASDRSSFFSSSKS